MVTTIQRRQAIFSRFFHQRSLKTRVTIFTLAIFMIGIWALAYYTSRLLHEDMERLLGEQQFSTVSFIAADINQQIEDRLRALGAIAERITPAMINNPTALQTKLEDSPILLTLFNAGIVAMALDSTVIADVPLSAARLGNNYKDRDHIVTALREGKATVGKPNVGKVLRAPVFGMIVPIHNAQGKMIGALMGVTDLGKPNFLDKITGNRYGQTGGYLLVAPKYRLIVTSTDKGRIMEELPVPGINPSVDRFIQGYEGSIIFVNPLGEEVLASAKGIPMAGWYAVAALPTKEAFAPVHTMLERMVQAALFLTLLAGVLTWWMLRRQLAPMFATVKTLATLSDTKTLLPITSQDEIGELIGGFNRLLQTLAQREGALVKSEERHKTILHTALNGFCLLDTQGHLLEVNETYCRMSGYSRQELQAMSITDLEAAETTDDTAAHIQKVMTQGEDRFESRHRRKDGSIFDIEVSVQYRPTDGGWFLAFLQDITERKRVEEDKRRNQERAQQIAEEMGIIAQIGRAVGSTLDINQVYERVANEVCKLIPYDRFIVNLKNVNDNEFVVYSSGVENPGRRLAGSYPSNGSATGVVMAIRTGILIQPDDAEEIKDLYPNLYETFKIGLRSTLAVPLIFMDEVIGSMNFRSQKLKAYTDKDLRLAERIGMQIAGAIANAQLFSDLSKTEKSLRESEERLQRAEKMEALGQLAGGVAHDLNNVLGILSGYSELLLLEIPEGQRSRSHVEKILQSTEKGAAIIQDLLTLARRGVAASEVINLNSVVSGFLKTPVFEKTKDYHPRVTFRIEYDENLLNIKGSPVHLEKTLMNLVANAAESISGKGEVTIRTESRYLDRTIRGYDEVREGDYAVLTVSDTGMGIPAENREKIFEPFYTKKTMGRSGTGLGLAIVWGTVKDHNGYIDVQTEVGQGTTFTLYFPVTREELVAPRRKEPIEHYMGRSESVLVVDDIAEQRDVAAGLLTRLGFEVHVVSSGEEALEYLGRNKTDILVLDMIMAPGIDGLETYKRVLEINPRQKAILVSGFSETERVREAQKLGAGAYVRKPYVMEKIGIAIREELIR